MVAKTLTGLEEVLAKELLTLGAKNIQPEVRNVTFTGDMGFLYKANLWLRTAIRIMVPIEKYNVKDEDDLYVQTKAIDWSQYMTVDQSFMIDATLSDDSFNHSLYVAQKMKDAIVDQFRDKHGKRPNVDTDSPDIRINAYIRQNRVIISLDSSGDSLHKRGYRTEVDAAPMNEVLAAGLLKLAGWEGQSDFYDPMCGSGTLLIEANMIAQNIPPNIMRKNFCFKNWANYDVELFSLIFDKALEKPKHFHFNIIGSDVDEYVLQKADQNIKNAMMVDDITTIRHDFFSPALEGIHLNSFVMFNPPFGIKIQADVEDFYDKIGKSLKFNYAGKTAWIFTAAEEGVKKIGLRPKRKFKLYSGNLDSWLLGYEMFAGKRKEHLGGGKN